MTASAGASPPASPSGRICSSPPDGARRRREPALGATGSLRLLRRAAVAERLRAGYEQGPPARTRPLPTPGAEDDSDVMEREIMTIPAVIRERLELSGQTTSSTVERIRDADVRHLALVGCGDSSFACQAAVLALNRHSGLRVHWEHALDFARYGVRYQPAGTAVVVVSFSGQTGRTIEAARQAGVFGHLVIGVTGALDSPMAQAVDCVLSAETPTFGFSPGTSTYTAMLVTLLTLAAELGAARESSLDGAARYAEELARLPELAEETIRQCGDASYAVAEGLVGARMTTFLGAGPNEATAKFGAAKLFEGAQQLAVVTNIEEWAHEQYFTTRPGDPVVLIAPRGAATDRAAEILSELNYVDAAPVFVSDLAPPGPARPPPGGGGGRRGALPGAGLAADEHGGPAPHAAERQAELQLPRRRRPARALRHHPPGHDRRAGMTRTQRPARRQGRRTDGADVSSGPSRPRAGESEREHSIWSEWRRRREGWRLESRPADVPALRPGGRRGPGGRRPARRLRLGIGQQGKAIDVADERGTGGAQEGREPEGRPHRRVEQRHAQSLLRRHQRHRDGPRPAAVPAAGPAQQRCAGPVRAGGIDHPEGLDVELDHQAARAGSPSTAGSPSAPTT